MLIAVCFLNTNCVVRSRRNLSKAAHWLTDILPYHSCKKKKKARCCARFLENNTGNKFACRLILLFNGQSVLRLIDYLN